MSSFNWDQLLAGTPNDSGSTDALFASLLAGVPNTNTVVDVPGLDGLPALSEGSSPESTESSEHSPAAFIPTMNAGHKRKSDGGIAVTAPQKDLRATGDTLHSHIHDAEGTSKAARGGVSEKRRDQNRAAQRAFRERKEAHVRNLQERVTTLEGSMRDRDLENDNLRDLVNQLRKENERLGAGQNRFTMSTFTSAGQEALSRPTPAPQMSKIATTPVSSFPAMTLGGLGPNFLRELSAPQQQPRRVSSESSSVSSPAGRTISPSSSISGGVSSDASAFELFTPGGQHFNLGAASASVVSPANGIGLPKEANAENGGFDFDQYFVNLQTGTSAVSTEPLSMVAPMSPRGALSPQDAANLCPIKNRPADADIDQLCSEMKTKATCQEYARQALEAALQEDVKTMASMSSVETKATPVADFLG